MNNQRGSIWAWAIGAGIVVFIILWWLFHLQSWVAVLLGIVAAVLAVALSALGGGGSAPATVAQPARAAEAAPRPAPPVAEPLSTEDNDAVISAVSDKLKAEPEVAADAEPEASDQPLMSPPATPTTKRAAPSRSTASKPRSGDTRTEPRAKAPAARAGKPATAAATAPAATPAPAPAKPPKPAAAPKAAKLLAAAKPAAAPKAAKTATSPAAAPKVAKPAAAKPAAAKPAAAPKTATAAKPAKPDDLKKIKGISPAIEKALRSAGVTTFAQIAKWKKADIDKFDEAISGPARIEHEDWVGQAKALAKGQS